MLSKIKLKCVGCQKEYSPGEVFYTCPDCGADKGLIDIFYDYQTISKKVKKNQLIKNTNFNISRYEFILPIKDKSLLPPLRVGGTPLYFPRRLQKYLGLENLFLKDDTLEPTASFKDRASAVGIACAVEQNVDTIAAASTGNAASSVAGLGAASGMNIIIFVPKTAPRAKVAQLLMYGAKVFMVDGTYDEAFDFCFKVCQKYGWYNRNTGINPYLLEGKKTAALEICEQLDFSVPDKVIVSTGDGCILGSVYKGFYDFWKLHWIEKIPQIIGIQAEGASPLKEAFDENSFIKPWTEAQTIADSICVGYPRAAAQALRAVRSSGGLIEIVSDEEILEAMRTLASFAGIFAEPAGAAGFAGLVKLVSQGKIKTKEKVVVLITGNGLKDIDSAFKAVKNQPVLIKPDLDEFAELCPEGSDPS